MIPAKHPYVATYKYEGTRLDGTEYAYWSKRPVVAWSDDGEPLVAGDRGLQHAGDWANFDGIQESTDVVVAVVPGGGWHAEYKWEDSIESNPIVAWVFYADGSCLPFDSAGDGTCENATANSNFVRVFHPDQRPDATTPAA